MDKKIYGARRDSGLRSIAEERVALQPDATGSFQEEMNDKRLLHELQVHQIELEMQNNELHRTQTDLLAERSLKNDLVTWLAQTSSRDADELFFNKLARYLATCLEMDFVCIDSLEVDGLSARTLAVWCDGHFEDNVTYALKDTPCGNVVGTNVCCFPAMVCQLFPHDQVLQELRAESYVGVTLWDHTGSPIGLIAVISRRPLVNRQQTETMMQLVAERAAAELERMNAEEALRDSEERFRNLLQEVPSIAVQGYGPDGTAQYWNLASEKLYGYSAQEAIGRNLLDLIIPPEMRNDVEQAIRYMAETGQSIPAAELLLMRKDGSRVPVFSSHTIVKVSGRVQELFCLDIDLSQRKQAEQEKLALEQQLQQTQKLESLGVLAGGIAHDFNNLLAVIIGNCSLAMLNPKSAENHIPQIEIAANRAAELCRQMLAYAGKSQYVQSVVNVRELVHEMITMLRSTISQNVVISSELPSDISPIKADASQIRQIIMNLVINAAEAIGEAPGEVKVSLTKTSVTATDPFKDHLGKIIPEGDYLSLEVTDNGCGMDDITTQRLFEPFFTTKFTGRGLGMSAVLGIIKGHHGALQLFSQPEKGSTFKVYLPAPACKSTEQDPVELPASSPPWQGSGTILLVEDEEHVMRVANAMLKEIGFDILEASNGKEALELYQKSAEDFLLVVTDIGMPVMDGCALFRELKKLNPKLPIIISSGFGDMTVTSKMPREDIAGLIAKPYNISQLREVLQRVVEGEC